MWKMTGIIVSIVVLCFSIVGCSGGVSEDKPIAEVAKEAETLSADQLEAKVASYQKAIEAKKGDIDKIKAEVAKIAVKDMLGDKAKSLKNDLSDVSKSMKALSERMNVYAKELSKKAK